MCIWLWCFIELILDRIDFIGIDFVRINFEATLKVIMI